MPYFITAAEVWLPDESGRFLVLGSAHYGERQEQALSEFQAASKTMRFAINEGLPGKTWAERRPLIWTDLNADHFKRSTLAEQAELTCGLSIPVFAGEFLLGVVVLFCSGGADIAGVVEVWHNRDYYDNELRLTNGYYGTLARFESISRLLTIMRGRGLPGLAWSLGCPIIMTNLTQDNSFLRARNAAEANLSTGLAIPFFYTERDVQVVTFLSTDSTPAAARFEVWQPDEAHRYLLFNEGYCANGSNLKALYRSKAYDRGESTLGLVWLNGRPLVEKAEETDLVGSIYIPSVVNGLLRAVVRIVF